MDAVVTTTNIGPGDEASTNVLRNHLKKSRKKSQNNWFDFKARWYTNFVERRGDFRDRKRKSGRTNMSMNSRTTGNNRTMLHQHGSGMHLPRKSLKSDRMYILEQLSVSWRTRTIAAITNNERNSACN